MNYLSRVGVTGAWAGLKGSPITRAYAQAAGDKEQGRVLFCLDGEIFHPLPQSSTVEATEELGLEEPEVKFQ